MTPLLPVHFLVGIFQSSCLLPALLLNTSSAGSTEAGKASTLPTAVLSHAIQLASPTSVDLC